MLIQQGHFLIEVLISLMLLSIILLGIDGMQMNTFSETKNVYLLSVAMQQLQNMAERLRTKPIHLAAFISEWNKENALLLPQGHGVVTGRLPDVTLTIFWGKPFFHCDKPTIGSAGCLFIKL